MNFYSSADNSQFFIPSQVAAWICVRSQRYDMFRGWRCAIFFFFRCKKKSLFCLKWRTADWAVCFNLLHEFCCKIVSTLVCSSSRTPSATWSLGWAKVPRSRRCCERSRLVTATSRRVTLNGWTFGLWSISLWWWWCRRFRSIWSARCLKTKGKFARNTAYTGRTANKKLNVLCYKCFFQAFFLPDLLDS